MTTVNLSTNVVNHVWPAMVIFLSDFSLCVCIFEFEKYFFLFVYNFNWFNFVLFYLILLFYYCFCCMYLSCLSCCCCLSCQDLCQKPNKIYWYKNLKEKSKYLRSFLLLPKLQGFLPLCLDVQTYIHTYIIAHWKKRTCIKMKIM